MQKCRGTYSSDCVRDFDKLNLVKVNNGGSVLNSRQFLLCPQLLQKMMLTSEAVKSDWKIIIIKNDKIKVVVFMTNSNISTYYKLNIFLRFLLSCQMRKIAIRQ